MRKPTSILAMAAVLIATVGLCAPEAHAQSRRQGSRVMKSGSSSSRSRSISRSGSTSRGSSSRSRSAPSSRGSSSRGRSSPSSRFGSSGGSRSGSPGLGNLGNLGNLGDVLNGIGNRTRGGGFDRYGYGDRRRGRDEYSDAYREVGFAHAIVNLIGIIAETSTNNRALRQAQPAQPAPQLVREKVVVQPGRYEQYEVQVPARYDPNTGQLLGGGYTETRTRWLPEVVQYRDVYVMPR